MTDSNAKQLCRHIWCEIVPYEKLREPGLQRALAIRGIQPIVAVRPETLAGLPDTISSLRDGGLSVSVWPMLEDRKGRWLSTHNTEHFLHFTTRMVDLLHRRNALPDEVALDLEPPIASMRALLRGKPTRVRGRSSQKFAVDQLVQAIGDLRALNIRCSAAILPLAVAGGPRSRRAWQRLLGTPIHSLPVDRVSTMSYTTLFEGYSRGFLNRHGSLALLDTLTRAAVSQFGERASVSIGCVGVGALGDERVYPTPLEFSHDVAIATAAGARDIAAYNLQGMLDRPPLEGWLDALAYHREPSRALRFSTRAAGVSRLVGALGAALSLRR